MSLKDQIMADVKSAMKEKDQERLNCLRFLQAAVKNREIEVRPNAISDDDVLGVIKKQVKQRQDSIEQYSKAGREDLEAKEKFELSVLEGYLPQQMSREQLEGVVTEVIAALGADSVKQMGAVMKEVIAKTKGAADNRVVSEVVKEKLQS
ncbi:MAG: GatB/YqeY domain-containing protein [Pseudobdellovibrionaceae bacterium]|nr:GatB/YqeY domain-containing protein [Bdellovibrionales bacterium]USN47117.1 MAG: GatB/YqeY domain-containing protein [Pseudobdellovibrionaceae bacterium]